MMVFQIKWNEENIRSALERFKSEHGRYPTSREFDITDYLPTARQIQRRFGGIPALRTAFKLGGEVDLTKGLVRAQTAAKTFARSYEYEESFYNYLLSVISEEFVHEQKRIRPGNVNCDFFIYNMSNKALSIVIDVFYADSLYNLAGIVNIKTKRYVNISYRSYLVSIGDKISQNEIDGLMRNKKFRLPDNIIVCSEKWFKDNLQTLLGR